MSVIFQRPIRPSITEDSFLTTAVGNSTSTVIKMSVVWLVTPCSVVGSNMLKASMRNGILLENITLCGHQPTYWTLQESGLDLPQRQEIIL